MTFEASRDHADLQFAFQFLAEYQFALVTLR